MLLNTLHAHDTAHAQVKVEMCSSEPERICIDRMLKGQEAPFTSSEAQHSDQTQFSCSKVSRHTSFRVRAAPNPHFGSTNYIMSKNAVHIVLCIESNWCPYYAPVSGPVYPRP